MQAQNCSHRAARTARCRIAYRVLCTLPVLAALAGCHTAPAVGAAAGDFAPPRGAEAYQIDPGASRLWLRLRADGPLAALGHDHVILAQQLHGTVWLHPQPERSALELAIPVAALVVDDPAERAAAGGEFAAPLDETARAGTRAHMLGERQLDGAHFPSILLRSQRVQVAERRTGAAGKDGGTLLVALQVTLRGHAAALRVPVSWWRSGALLCASGSVQLLQSELGLEPYSVALGALRVADRIDARFEFGARPQGSAASSNSTVPSGASSTAFSCGFRPGSPAAGANPAS